MAELRYFCNPESIEANAHTQIKDYAQNSFIHQVCAFTDVHYCDEKAVPVGVAFRSTDYFFPLITGKDIGCGVMYLQIDKADWLKPFDKKEHYKAFQVAHTKMTDDGLGGGNHFLSIEEDEMSVYIICHTGTRDRGIALFQHCYGRVQDFSEEYGSSVDFLPKSYADATFTNYYEQILKFGYERRKNFCLKTLAFLQIANYIRCQKPSIPKDYLGLNFANYPEKGSLYGTVYTLGDSIHNHLRFLENGDIIHRKGSTELGENQTAVIPLSMTRGSLLVKKNNSPLYQDALFSCAHGAGRKYSRFDTLKYWRSTLKEKERKEFKVKFSEMLNKSGDFPIGYIQEFDFAYKDDSEIFTFQPYLKKITETTPIVTLKYTEI